MGTNHGKIGLLINMITIAFTVHLSYSKLTDKTITNDGYNKTQERLLLMIIEGLRWDQITGLDGFIRLAESGVRPHYLQSVFPTNFLPNMYSMATGNLLLHSQGTN